MDSRAAMTYHLGNALLHLQYLAGHMPWFVPPADIAPAPASSSAATTPGLTTFVPHPGRPSYSASSSRPLTEYTICTSTIDGPSGIFIGPPPTRDPVSSSPNSYGLAPPAASTASAAPPVSEPRPPFRGLSISRSPPIPLSRHYPLTDSTSPPPSGSPVPPSIATPPSAPLDSSSVPAVNPVHPPSPVMAPDRRSKRRFCSHHLLPIQQYATSITSGFGPNNCPYFWPCPSHHGLPTSGPSSIFWGAWHCSQLRFGGQSALHPTPITSRWGEGTHTSTTTGVRPLAELCRNWAPVDDHELITYKKDTKARPSWKTIGQRLHRSAESCW
eukprot:s3088_g3.t1